MSFMTLDDYIDYQYANINDPMTVELDDYLKVHSRRSGEMTYKMEWAVENLISDIPDFPGSKNDLWIRYSFKDGFYFDEDMWLPADLSYEDVAAMISDYKNYSYSSPIRDKFWELFSSFENISPADYEDEELCYEAEEAYEDLLYFVLDELNANYDTLLDDYRSYALEEHLIFDPDDPLHSEHFSTFEREFDWCLRVEDWDVLADLLDTYRYDFNLENDPEYGSHFAAYFAGVPLEDVFA